MSAELIADLASTEPIAPRWDDTVATMRDPSVFFTHGWMIAAAEAFQDRWKPSLVVVERSGAFVGGAGVALDLADERRAHMLGAITADYCDIVSAPADHGEVAVAVLQTLREAGVTTLRLPNVPEGSPTLAAASELSAAARFRAQVRPETRAPRILFGSPSVRESISAAIADKESVKRHRRQLEREGPVEVVRTDTWPEAESHLMAAARHQSARFLATGRPAPLADPARLEFLRNICRRASEAGWLDARSLLVADQAVAWNIGFRFASTISWYLPAFDTARQKLWPGEVLLAEVVRQAAEDPMVTMVDLGIGTEFYKSRFSNEEITTYEVTFASTRSAHARLRAKQSAVRFADRTGHGEQLRRLSDTAAGRLHRLNQETPRSATTLIARNLKTRIRKKTEMRFFEWMEPDPQRFADDPRRLVPASWEVLGAAVLRFGSGDDAAIYLSRSAERLDEGGLGWALLDGNGEPVHLAWAFRAPDTSFSELNNRTLEQLGQRDWVIVDSYTPATERGKRHFPMAISLIGRELAKEAATVWGFASVDNVPSLKGLDAAGFRYRFTAHLEGWFGRGRLWVT
jgi:CelD/BcsL family acetyltransferase involved in cellulose biosynthesis